MTTPTATVARDGTAASTSRPREFDYTFRVIQHVDTSTGEVTRKVKITGLGGKGKTTDEARDKARKIVSFALDVVQDPGAIALVAGEPIIADRILEVAEDIVFKLVGVGSPA